MAGKEGRLTGAPVSSARGPARGQARGAATGSGFARSLGALVLQRYSVVYPLALILTAAVAILLGLDLAAVERLSWENHLIEDMTVVLYGLAILWLILGGGGDRSLRYQSAFVLCVMAARELSFQKAFTTESITRTSYWFRSEAPLSEKLLAGLASLSIAAILLRYFWRQGPRLWRRLGEGRSYAVSIFAAVMLVPVSKTLDSASRVLRDEFGMPVPDSIGTVLGLFEEMLELGIPLVLLWALCQLAVIRRRPDGAQPA